jgi:hypothetical protein
MNLDLTWPAGRLDPEAERVLTLVVLGRRVEGPYTMLGELAEELFTQDELVWNLEGRLMFDV